MTDKPKNRPKIRWAVFLFLMPFALLSCTSGGSSGASGNNGGGDPAGTPLSFTFVDGDGINGINKYPNESANYPDLTLFGPKFYVTWAENMSGSSVSQIRVAVYNGVDSAPAWHFVDGGGDSGINFNPAQNATRPKLAVFNNTLYAIWQEFGGTAEQIRVAAYNGDDNAPVWSFIDGGGATGINFDTTRNAAVPGLTLFQSKLYASWEELNGNNALQVRISVYQGGNGWLPVDSNSLTGNGARLIPDASGTTLYLFWQEFNGTATQVRMAEYSGQDSYPSWLFVDGVVKIGAGAGSCSVPVRCPVYSGGGLSGPSGIAFDAISGSLWTSNYNNSTVTRITSSAPTDCSSGCTVYRNGGISGPKGIRADGSGNLWVANSGTNSVTAVSSGAPADCSSGCRNFTNGGLSGPAGIAIDSLQNIWVTNSGNNSVTRISTGAAADCSSGCLNYTGGGLMNPAGVAVDSLNNVWIANLGTNSLTEITAGAAQNCSAGCVVFINLPAAAQVFRSPAAVAVDSSNNVWVANSLNSSITEIPASSADCTLCLNFTGGGINQPNGLAVDGSSNVWISNGDNSVTEILSGAPADCSQKCLHFATGGGSINRGIAIDSAGNAWITTLGSLGTNGFNLNPSKNALNPYPLLFNSKLYTAWEESNGTTSQIRGAVFNGSTLSPAWSFIDGGGMNGLNYNPAEPAHFPRLALYNASIFATWQEFNGVASQIRLSEYNGNDLSPAWSNADGNGSSGLNFNPGKGASYPVIASFNSNLYFAWSEYNYVSQIRILSAH